MSPDDLTSAARMRALAQLARLTAHELHGALNALRSHLELLAGTMTSPEVGKDRHRGHLDVVRSECSRVQRVADAFLALASPPGGSTPIDLGAVIAGVVEAVRPVALMRRVQLEGGPYPSVVSDPRAIEGRRQRVLDALLAVLGDAPPGSTVSVVVADAGKYTRIERAGGPPVTVTLAARGGGGDA